MYSVIIESVTPLLKLRLFLIELFNRTKILQFFLSKLSMISSTESVVNAETSFIWSISINCSMTTFSVFDITLIFFIKIRRFLILQLLMNFNSVTDCFNLFTVILTSFALLYTSYIGIFIKHKPLFQWVLLSHGYKHSNSISITIFFMWNLLFFIQPVLYFLVTSSKALGLIDYIRNFFSVTKE